MPAPGHRIGDRYELLDELPRTGGTALFRARDLAFGEVVALEQIERDPDSLRVLEAEVRRIQRTPHPQFARLYGIEFSEGMLVREWVHGFSLLDLLRRQRELPAPFALRLLESLPALLDATAEHAQPLLGSLLAKVLVRFDDSIAPETVSPRPIATWPAFSLKLNLLSLRAALPALDAENTTVTTLADLRKATAPEAPPVRRFAELLYEMLGGPLRRGRTPRYTPLPALREEGNGVLRRALLEAPYRDCRSLWADLALAEAQNFRPPAPLPARSAAPHRPWLRPTALAADAAPASLLKLTPANADRSAIHLVARPKFTIGRSISQADFVTRFLPASPANDDLTAQLSRIHVSGEATRSRVLLRDGNGDAGSVNGTTLDEAPLAAEQPATLDQRCLLTLGGVFLLEVIPQLTAAPSALDMAETEPAAAPKSLAFGGAIFFLAAHRQAVLREAVWLFTEAGFGLDAVGRIVWDTRGMGASPASFFYDRGGFWIANRALAHGDLQLDGHPLAPGEIAALQHAQELRIAAHRFTLALA